MSKRVGVSTKKNEHGLTERQELFIQAYVENGGNATKAAVLAGYPEKSAHARGHEALKSKAVQLRMETLVREKMYNAAPLAVGALMELAVSASSDTVRQAAAANLLDRTGYKVPVKVEITDHRTAAQVDAELAALLDIGVEEIAPVAASEAPSRGSGEDGQGNEGELVH